MSTPAPTVDLTWLPPSLRHVARPSSRSLVGQRPGAVDYPALNAQALPLLRTLLSRWLPQGTIVGQEYQVGSKAGEAGHSLSINLATGRWADFAEAEARGGDVISLLAYLKGLSQHAAARLLVSEMDTSHEPAAH